MPRKSAAKLAVAPVPVGALPPPPAELTEYQAALWHSVVSTKPADWFRPDTWDLLKAYCRHASMVDVISKQIDDFKPDWLAKDYGIERLEKLTKMRERESRAMLSMARSMRMTHQARYDKRVAAATEQRGRTSKGGKRPWEFDG